MKPIPIAEMPQEMLESDWTTERMKHRENVITLLQCSNVVPFKDKSPLGYICAYCVATFPNPQLLRAHTEIDHYQDRLEFKRNFELAKFTMKFDVADLHCTLCNEPTDNLNTLKEHLIKVHDKVIHNDIKDRMVQFRLKFGDVYDCALCTATYETFKMLKQHMHSHYSNFFCPNCGAAFATKISLKAHITSVHLNGTFKCGICEKVFANRTKLLYHEKHRHKGFSNIGNCPFCNESFRSYYGRSKHLVEVHNKEINYKCNECGKTFLLKSQLTYHSRKVHMMERDVQCTECDYRCFSKATMKKHMAKHSKVGKKFICSICHEVYHRNSTLKEHMRIHNNDRRYKCNECEMAFVQKCNLKRHLLTNHGISKDASEITNSVEVNNDTISVEVNNDMISVEVNNDMISVEVNNDIIVREVPVSFSESFHNE